MGELSSRAVRLVVCALIGVVSAFVGMLPWLVYGARLVLQNLWATPTADVNDMPVVLLPFSQYQLSLVAGVIIVGSLIAGVATRGLAAHGVWGARMAVAAGLLVAQFIALIQTAASVASGLQFGGGAGGGLSDEATIYLSVVCAWIVLAIGIGVLVFVLVTRRSSTPLALGAALAAVVLEPWLRGFLSPLTGSPVEPGSAGLVIAMWLPALLVAAAIGWAGIRVQRRVSVGRIVSAIAALVILWLGTSVLTGLVAAAGSRALARLPDELARLIASVTADELRGDALFLAAGAAALSAIAVAIHELIARSTDRAAERPALSELP